MSLNEIRKYYEGPTNYEITKSQSKMYIDNGKALHMHHCRNFHDLL